MRAVTYRGPHDLVVEEHEDRPLAPGEVRVTVESAGVCGTDVRIYKGEHSAYASAVGRIPGHEIVGRITEWSVAELDVGLAIGALVFVAPNIGCGRCIQCVAGNENLCPETDGIGITLNGGFAEHLIVPARAVAAGNLVPLDQGINVDTAVLIEPLACVLRGQDKIHVQAGDTVLVAGGGPVGLLHTALALSRGASQVICSEPSPARREAATTAGATTVVDPTSVDLATVVSDATDGRGMDVVITAAPIHALQRAAIELAAPRGRILFFGGLPKSQPTVELDTNAVHYKELTVAGTTASSLSDCQVAAELLARDDIQVDWMISEVRALDDFAGAIHKVQDASALKVVVKP